MARTSRSRKCKPRVKAKLTQPPALAATAFGAWLQGMAEDAGFKSWHFRSGMLSGDFIEWWGAHNLRRTRHEGLDFAEGRTPSGEIRALPYGIPVRAMLEGEVSLVIDDFIGKTVGLKHPRVASPEGAIFYTFYSHIQPEVALGTAIAAGQKIGSIAPRKNKGAPAHLHLSGAWVPNSIEANKITIDMISPGYAPIILVDFNPLLPRSALA